MHPHAQERRARHERALFVRVATAGDARARDELVDRFLPLAYALALRFEHAYESLDDLVQVASVGLLNAIDRFDPSRGTAFSSFAVPTMLGEIRRHVRDRTWAVHVPRGLQELALRVEEDGFERVEDRATLEALMDVLSIREHEVLRMRFAQDMTQAEIGAVIGVSQMQVSRIIRGTLERLRALAEPALTALASAPLD